MKVLVWDPPTNYKGFLVFNVTVGQASQDMILRFAF